MKFNFRAVIIKVFFLLFIVGVCFIGYIEYVYRKSIKTDVYTEFLTDIKFEEYDNAYKKLYPLIVQKDKKAINLISRAYLGDYGIDMDIIKSNIWKEREGVCLYCETGFKEFKQYQVFLNKKDHGMASVFLQKSAEQGNEQAIMILKDEKFLVQNNLSVEPNWKKYWQDFDYDNLYPYCQKIEACRKDVEIRKNKRSNHQ